MLMCKLMYVLNTENDIFYIFTYDTCNKVNFITSCYYDSLLAINMIAWDPLTVSPSHADRPVRREVSGEIYMGIESVTSL